MPWPESWLRLARDDEPEQIDDPAQPYAEIVRSMQDVARTNRFFGGTQTILFHIARLLKDAPKDREIWILDIATGSGDIPRALSNWGRQHQINLKIVAIDTMPAMLRLAQEQPEAPILIQADAGALPFAPRSFDLAFCALAFHHFGFELSAKVMAAMDALTTRGFVISDLRRDRPTLHGVSTALTLMQAHSFTRHDGPASVRRAFTPPEYRKIVGLSGAQNVRLFAHWYYRIALVQSKPTEDWVNS